MQPVAAWLVARPQNGVLGLAGTILLPLSPIISGAVMTMLVMQSGLRISVLQALVAAAILSATALLAKAPLEQVLVNAAGTWLPAAFLAVLIGRWRSLTLTLQASAIIAVGATLAFFVVLGDPTEYWDGVVSSLGEIFRSNGLQEQADLLVARQSVIVPQMTMLFVFFSWSLYVLVLLLGYALFQSLPGQDGVFGRFRDLNFGRVLALFLAVASLLALVTGAAWLQNVAFVIFAVFWIQGLALLHWLRAEGRIPIFVLVAAYALLPVLNVLLIVTFAVIGYTDAWFNYRLRGRTADG